jgi:hypothetical protein
VHGTRSEAVITSERISTHGVECKVKLTRTHLLSKFCVVELQVVNLDDCSEELDYISRVGSDRDKNILYLRVRIRIPTHRHLGNMN